MNKRQPDPDAYSALSVNTATHRQGAQARGAWRTNGVFSADPASPPGDVSKCCVTQNQVRMKRDAPGVGVNTNTRPTLAHCTMPHGHGQVHTCGMQVCELTAVALTAAPLPPPRSLRRARASTSPRLA